MKLIRFSSLLSLSLLFNFSYSHNVKLPKRKNYDSHDYYVLHTDINSGYDLSLEEFGEELGLEFIENVGEFDNHHLFRVLKEDEFSIDRFENNLMKRDKASHPYISLTKQVPRQRLHKRSPLPINDLNEFSERAPITESALVASDLDINDPIFSEQWHLVNDKKPEHSINVANVWRQNIKGQGVRVAIVDDGLDMHSIDLAENFFSEGSWDFNDHTALPEPRLREDSHGTRCAGEIGAVRNDACGVGVAYESKVAGIRILSTPISDADEATALNYGYQLNDIYSCSWGPPDDGKAVEAPSDLIQKAFVNGIQRGRDGKGSIYVFASGNGGASDDQCNFDGYTNSIYSITVAAVSRDGVHPYYSEACTANLVVTYSSGSGDSIHTTDVGENSCTTRHGGTSAAAPIAAGIYALVLQVRPELGWRDLQHLSVQTAEPINLNEDGWGPTSVGRMYNNLYGYGKLNTERIVEAAKHHQLVKPQAWYEGPIVHMKNVTKGILGQPLSNEWFESTFHFSGNRMKQHNLERLEHVTVNVWIDHERRGDIEVELVSPDNVTSVLAKPRRYDAAPEGLNGWKFMTTKHWDENPVGDWKIRVKDGFHSNVNHGNFKAWSISFWGECIDETKTVDYILPFERPHDSDLLNGDDNNDESNDINDGDNIDEDEDDQQLPPQIPIDSASTTYQYTKPTQHLPDEHHQASNKIPNESYTPTPDEGYIDNSTFLLNHQTWMIGAGIVGLTLISATATVWFIRRRRAQKFARADEDSRGVYATLNQGNGDSHRMTEFSSSNGGRTRELYDAFKLTDSDSEDEENDDDNNNQSQYRDDEGEEQNDENQVLFDNDNENENEQSNNNSWTDLNNHR